MICGSTPGKGVRFNRKTQNANERKLLMSYWKEITQLYGTYGDYFVYNYQLSAHDFLYGEQPLAPYIVPPKGFPILAEFQNDSMLLSKFGIQTEADVVFIIPIQTFYEQFGNGAEPKSGDLIRLTELGWDRPGGVNDLNTARVAPVTSCSDYTDPLEGLCSDGILEFPAIGCNTDRNAYSAYDDAATFASLLRGAPVYEITERRDENMTQQYNALAGHYVWVCHGKKFDYSYQPNAPREPGSNQVSDETIFGLISSTIGTTGFPATSSLPLPEDVKALPRNFEDNVTEEARPIWDYTIPSGADDSVYGEY